MLDDDIDDMFGLVMVIIFFNFVGFLKMCLIFVEIDFGGDVMVVWSDLFNWFLLLEGVLVILLGGMNIFNISVIMFEIEYDYMSLFGEFLLGIMIFNDRFFFIFWCMVVV